MFWFHGDGTQVVTSSERAGSHRIQLPDGGLFFLKARDDLDAGVYWCKAVNEYGEVRSRNATLEIACKFGKNGAFLIGNAINFIRGYVNRLHKKVYVVQSLC